jgi:hypothetical protein
MTELVSPSRLGAIARCGEAFRRRYIERERTPPAVGMLVGRAVDDSVSRNLRAKMAGVKAPIEKLLDTARDSLRREWDEEPPELDEREAADGEEKTRDQAVDRAVRLAELHAKEVAPTLAPVDVQRGFGVELTGLGRPVKLIGYIDILEADAVRDTKTSRRTPAQDAADDSLQLTFYALAVRELDGQPPRYVALDYLVDNKRQAFATCRTSLRTQDDYDSLILRIRRYLAALEHGVFQPAQPTDWWCSKRWCSYWTTCPFARRPVSILT